jgi:tyrosine-protein kinase Etk/Wzc
MDDLKFTLSDVVKVLKRHKKTLLVSIFACAFLAGLLAITRPSAYIVQATFRDKGKSQASIHSSVSDFLFNSATPYDSEAIAMMKSRFLLSKVASELNSQASVSKIENRYPLLENAYANALSEWAYWRNSKTPLLDDVKTPLSLKNVAYDRETSRGVIVTFEDPYHFQAAMESGLILGKGKLETPFESKEIAFTLVNEDNTPIEKGDRFSLAFFPMQDIAKSYGAHLMIRMDNDDKSLLNLRFQHQDRQFAAKLVNLVMDTYQNHLENQHEQLSTAQVDYLERRQSDVGTALEKLMEEYVQNVSEDMALSGFTSLQKEMEFLSSKLAHNQQKLSEIDLEMRRLKATNCDNCVCFDSYSGRVNPAMINQLLSEMRQLKTQGDSLELAMQNTQQLTPKTLQDRLDTNFKTLEKTRAYLAECHQLIESLQTNDSSFTLKALDTSAYPVSTWYSSYLQKNDPGFKEHLLTYLQTFYRLMKIQESTLEQRMRTQSGSDFEFEGINLETSRTLHLAYMREYNDLEAEEMQLRFVVEQLANPDFELSSLTALLQDPISHARITRASEIMINLKDENNHTQKERERQIEELELQKSFLVSHIKQIADLTKIKSRLIQEKMASLQGISLDLIQQQISLLKKQFSDYVSASISHLDQEKQLLEEDQAALHRRLAKVPPKWTSEQLLNYHLQLHQKFLENLAAMVESKNITKNLEMIQSAPLDRALPPLNPKPPHIIFYSLLGAFLGFFGASGFLFVRTIQTGMQASIDNLRLAHFHVSGSITPFQGDESSEAPPLFDSDLNTLRRLIGRMEPVAGAKQLLILNGSGSDFSNILAQLLAKKGERVIKMQLGFQEFDGTTGLLQYIEGETEFPSVEHQEGFDCIASGGICRYSEELLKSPRFIYLLKSLSASYDWVIGVSPAKIMSAEGENLAKLFTGSAIVITHETLEEVVAFSKTLSEHQRIALSFIFSSS